MKISQAIAEGVELEKYADCIIPCWKCNGSKLNSKGTGKCRTCGGDGRYVSDLALISRAIAGMGERHGNR